MAAGDVGFGMLDALCYTLFEESEMPNKNACLRARFEDLNRVF